MIWMRVSQVSRVFLWIRCCQEGETIMSGCLNKSHLGSKTKLKFIKKHQPLLLVSDVGVFGHLSSRPIHGSAIHHKGPHIHAYGQM